MSIPCENCGGGDAHADLEISDVSKKINSAIGHFRNENNNMFLSIKKFLVGTKETSCLKNNCRINIKSVYKMINEL
jgi:hypothetical protein